MREVWRIRDYWFHYVWLFVSQLCICIDFSLKKETKIYFLSKKHIHIILQHICVSFECDSTPWLLGVPASSVLSWTCPMFLVLARCFPEIHSRDPHNYMRKFTGILFSNKEIKNLKWNKKIKFPEFLGANGDSVTYFCPRRCKQKSAGASSSLQQEHRYAAAFLKPGTYKPHTENEGWKQPGSLTFLVNHQAIQECLLPDFLLSEENKSV